MVMVITSQVMIESQAEYSVAVLR